MTKFVAQVRLTYNFALAANTKEEAEALSLEEIDTGKWLDFACTDYKPVITIITMSEYEALYPDYDDRLLLLR